MRSVLGTHYLSSYVGERGMEHNISQFNPLKCHHSSCKSKHGSPKIRQRRPVQWTVEEADTTRGGTDTWQRIRCSISALLNLQLSATQPKKGIGEGQICSSCNDGCLKLSFSLSLSLSVKTLSVLPFPVCPPTECMRHQDHHLLAPYSLAQVLAELSERASSRLHHGRFSGCFEKPPVRLSIRLLSLSLSLSLSHLTLVLKSMSSRASERVSQQRSGIGDGGDDGKQSGRSSQPSQVSSSRICQPVPSQ
jgi:hypothetical protein